MMTWAIKRRTGLDTGTLESVVRFMGKERLEWQNRNNMHQRVRSGCRGAIHCALERVSAPQAGAMNCAPTSPLHIMQKSYAHREISNFCAVY